MTAGWSVEELSGRAGLAIDDGLVREASEGGFRFIDRLVTEWRDSVNRFDAPGEIFLGALSDNGQTIAVGGLNRDLAYSDGLGRLRHLYVRGRSEVGGSRRRWSTGWSGTPGGASTQFGCGRTAWTRPGSTCGEGTGRWIARPRRTSCGCRSDLSSHNLAYRANCGNAHSLELSNGRRLAARNLEPP